MVVGSGSQLGMFLLFSRCTCWSMVIWLSSTCASSAPSCTSFPKNYAPTSSANTQSSTRMSARSWCAMGRRWSMAAMAQATTPALAATGQPATPHRRRWRRPSKRRRDKCRTELRSVPTPMALTFIPQFSHRPRLFPSAGYPRSLMPRRPLQQARRPYQTPTPWRRALRRRAWTQRTSRRCPRQKMAGQGDENLHFHYIEQSSWSTIRAQIVMSKQGAVVIRLHLAAAVRGWCIRVIMVEWQPRQVLSQTGRARWLSLRPLSHPAGARVPTTLITRPQVSPPLLNTSMPVATKNLT